MKTKKPKTDIIESTPVERYVIPGDLDRGSIQTPLEKVTLVKTFYNESALSDFIHDHEDYVIISVFSHEGHITGIFMTYE